MDSGASSHITHDAAIIDCVTSTYGKEKIVVGNGDKINVYKFGVSALAYTNHHHLTLKDVLHAPRVIKNLLSVSKLTSHNNILIQFDSAGYNIKDKDTGNLLLEGQMKDGLYEFKKKSHPSCLVSIHCEG